MKLSVVKLIAFLNVLWVLVLISLELILVYEYSEKGLRDVIPSLIGSEGVSSDNSNTTKYCTYHMYRKYACKKTKSASQINSTDFISFYIFLPLLWFGICCLDILVSLALYKAAVEQNRRWVFSCLCTGIGILMFQIIILVMEIAVHFNVWSEIPLTGYCIFKLFDLYIVQQFYSKQLSQELEQHQQNNLKPFSRKISYIKKVKIEDDDDDVERNETRQKHENEIIDNGTNTNNRCNSSKIKPNSTGHQNSYSSNSSNHVDVNSSCNSSNNNNLSTLSNLRKLSHAKPYEPLPLLIFK